MIAGFRSVDDALVDYSEVKELYRRGVIDTYDAALISKRDDGTVHVSRREKPTQKAAWTGAIVGAVVGVLFPPAIVTMVAAGGITGGLIGHLWAGMSRADLKELGEALDTGMAAVVVIGKTSLVEKLGKATARATRTIERQLEVDGRDLEKEIANVVQAVA
jgi:uncharacterized membrane protein